MSVRQARTAEGDAATQVVLETFRVNGLLLAAGNRLAAQEALTAALWQVLGAVALAGRQLTVPQIARRLGLTRQAVQATVNRLLAEALAEARDNPDHRRSPLRCIAGPPRPPATSQAERSSSCRIRAGTVLAHQEQVFGPPPSGTTLRRTLELADARILGKIARARARCIPAGRLLC